MAVFAFLEVANDRFFWSERLGNIGALATEVGEHGDAEEYADRSIRHLVARMEALRRIDDLMGS